MAKQEPYTGVPRQPGLVPLEQLFDGVLDWLTGIWGPQKLPLHQAAMNIKSEPW